MPDFITTLLQINKSVTFSFLASIKIAYRKVISQKMVVVNKNCIHVKLVSILCENGRSVKVLLKTIVYPESGFQTPDRLRYPGKVADIVEKSNEKRS